MNNSAKHRHVVCLPHKLLLRGRTCLSAFHQNISDIKKTMSDVEKKTSDIVKKISDIVFAVCKHLKSTILQPSKNALRSLCFAALCKNMPNG